MFKSKLTGFLLLVGIICLTVTPVLEAGGDRIILKNGNEVTGTILKRTKDRIVLDLDFTVLSVPASKVKKITSYSDQDEKPDRVIQKDLWYARKGLERKPVSKVAPSVSEAVVKIKTPIGMGSGFIIQKNGYVITNNHVISGTRKISLTVYRKQEKSLIKDQYENVKIIATSPGFDLALLKIMTNKKKTFPTVPLGSSSELEKGETVFAIGSPMGFERTVTKGVVSLKYRKVRKFPHIQTSTEINPGNSGGPLFNTKGEVIGVTNMKIRSMLGVEGLGFAIPVNVVKWFLETRNAFAFDTENPNAGFHYHSPSANRKVNPDGRKSDGSEENQ